MFEKSNPDHVGDAKRKGWSVNKTHLCAFVTYILDQEPNENVSIMLKTKFGFQYRQHVSFRWLLEFS